MLLVVCTEGGEGDGSRPVTLAHCGGPTRGGSRCAEAVWMVWWPRPGRVCGVAGVDEVPPRAVVGLAGRDHGIRRWRALRYGWLSPLGSIGMASSMLTAIARVHWPKVWATERGFELPLTYLVVALAVGISGPGAYSLDAVLRTRLPAGLTAVLVTVALVGWIVGLTISATPPA